MFKTKTEHFDREGADNGSTGTGGKPDKDVLAHLLDIENSVAGFVLEAQTEADKRIAAAKEEAEKEYKLEYNKIIAEFEAEFLKEKEAEDAKQQAVYKEFDEYLSSLKKDYKRFGEYIDSCFFGV